AQLLQKQPGPAADQGVGVGDRVLEVGEHVFHRRFEQLLPSKGGRARVGIPHEPDEGLNVFRRQAPHVNPPLLGYPVPSLSGASRRDRGMPVKREKLRARRRTIGDRRNSTGITGNGIASQSTASVIGLFLQYDPETCPLSRAGAANRCAGRSRSQGPANAGNIASSPYIQPMTLRSSILFPSVFALFLFLATMAWPGEGPGRSVINQASGR